LITILDYGINNLSSISKAVKHLGFEGQVRRDLSGASKLIIPGVGAFGAAMQALAPLADEIRAFARVGNPVFGICLGQQLLFERSEEYGDHEGLGLVPGRVRYFAPQAGLKVPHMGWNEAKFRLGSALGEGVADGAQVYFVHSLVCEPEDDADVAAMTTYGQPFASAIQRGNVWGTQFHPEKSSATGLHILRNFLAC